jgi:hypothetical protein
MPASSLHDPTAGCWYEGDAERMARALHPELFKRIVRTDQKTGHRQVQPLRSRTPDALGERARGSSRSRYAVSSTQRP